MSMSAIYRKSIAQQARIADLQTVSQGRIRRPLGSTDAFSKVRLGVESVNGRFVTIRAGSLTIGTATYAITSRSVEISGGSVSAPDWIYVNKLVNSGNAQIAPVAVADYPTSNTSELRYPLFGFYFDGTQAVLVHICHFGDIVLPGNFAA